MVDEQEVKVNRFKKIKNGIVNKWKTCCGCASASFAYTVSFVSLTLCVLSFYVLSAFPMEDRNVGLIENIIYWILTVFGTISTVMLIYGTLKKKMYYLLPWLIFVMILLIADFVYYIYEIYVPTVQYQIDRSAVVVYSLVILGVWTSILLLFLKFRKYKTEVDYNSFTNPMENIIIEDDDDDDQYHHIISVF